MDNTIDHDVLDKFAKCISRQSPQFAEDVYQTAYLKGLEFFSKYQHKKVISKRYLFLFMQNETYRELQREVPVNESTTPHAGQCESSVLSYMTTEDILRQYDDSFGTLRNYLRLGEFAEIAKEEGISPSAVWWRLNEIKKRAVA